MALVELVLLDVNETLSDLRPLGERVAAAGAPPGVADTWFAATLRDGFALAVMERTATFRAVGAGVLRTLLAPYALVVPLEEAVTSVLEGFSALPLHPDVEPGLRRLSDAGVRVATLSNGASSVAEGLLERAGLRHLVDRVLSVEDAGRWKPHAQAYRYALTELAAAPGRTALVAVHPWDVVGARAAGLLGGWVCRQPASPWPTVFERPDAEGVGLDGVAEALLSL